jgi:hypothetical protein
MILFLPFYTCHSHSRALVLLDPDVSIFKPLRILSVFGCTPLVLFADVLYVINYLQKKNIRYAYELNCVPSFYAVSKPLGNMKHQCSLSSRNSLNVTSGLSQ